MPTATRILLVDDVAMLRDLGAIFLARSGPVDLAANAAEAFRRAAARPPSIVISDMHLPDRDGTELCRLFKTVRPSAHDDGPPRVILLARPDSPRDHADAVRAGCDEVLFKPLERDALIAAVRRLADRSSPRGLPRAAIEQPVEITAGGRRVEGIVRNVSRGGVFLRAPLCFEEHQEIALAFSLGDARGHLAPTAQVVWRGPNEVEGASAGLRFLEIDALAIERLDHYVNEHFPRSTSLPA